jgi:hypothetical protein
MKEQEEQEVHQMKEAVEVVEEEEVHRQEVVGVQRC